MLERGRLDQLLHLLNHFRFGGAHQLGDAVRASWSFLETFESAYTGDGFDAAHARGDAAFRDDFAEADLAGVVDVCAAAQLAAEAGDRDHAHVFSVLFTEQRHCAGGQRLVEIHQRPSRPAYRRICSFMMRSTSAISAASSAA